MADSKGYQLVSVRKIESSDCRASAHERDVFDIAERSSCRPSRDPFFARDIEIEGGVLPGVDFDTEMARERYFVVAFRRECVDTFVMRLKITDAISS